MLADGGERCHPRGLDRCDAFRDGASVFAMDVDLNPVRVAIAETPDRSPHTSAFDRMEASRGKQIPSAAFDLVPLPIAESANEIRDTPVDELRQKRKQKKRNPTGRRIYRDGWLAPLTLAPGVLSTDAQSHKDGLRASDKGFLHVSLREYLRLLRWTAKQSVDGITSKVPASLAATLTQIGIEASMWRDLVWHWQRFFGKSTCVGRPESMRSDAGQRGREWHRRQRSASVCFT